MEVDNGIVVDELCRTAVDGIFAAGDVARHLHPLFGSSCASSTGSTRSSRAQPPPVRMLGKGEPYAELHWFWSDQYDANLQYAGHHRDWDELVVRGSLDERRFVGFYLEGGVVALRRLAVETSRAGISARAQALDPVPQVAGRSWLARCATQADRPANARCSSARSA